MSTGIEWTDETWPERTIMRFVDGNGRSRARVYRRQRTDGPGVQERRRQRANGLSWCRGCKKWLPAESVLRQGVCRPCANAEYRARYAAHPEPIRAQKYARRRSLEPVPDWWATDHRATFDGRCAYGCGRAGTTWDHVWPVIRGGRSTPGNLVPACSPCNSSKRDAHPGPWITRGFAAFPAEWRDLLALAIEHGTDDWAEAA